MSPHEPEPNPENLGAPDPAPALKGDSTQKWLVGAALFVVIATVSATLYLILVPGDVGSVQYRLVLLLLFFSLSTLSTAIFGGSARVEGRLLSFSLYVGGPAAIWLVCLLLFNHVFPERLVLERKPISIAEFQAQVANLEAEFGWTDLNGWKKSMEGFAKLPQTTRHVFLENAAAVLARERKEARMEKVQVTTLFVYHSTANVKIQRIRGQRQTDQESALIPFRSASTDPGAKTKSIFLVAEVSDNGLKLDHVKGGSSTEELGLYEGYQEVLREEIDCLLITLYENESPPDEDYFLVDLGALSRENVAELNLGLVSFDHKLQEASLWAVRRPFTSHTEPPLAFSHLRAGLNSDLTPFARSFKGWFDLIDNELAEEDSHLTDEDKRLLRSIIATMLTPDSNQLQQDEFVEQSFNQFLNRENAPQGEDKTVAYHVPNARHLPILFVRFRQGAVADSE